MVKARQQTISDHASSSRSSARLKSLGSLSYRYAIRHTERVRGCKRELSVSSDG